MTCRVVKNEVQLTCRSGPWGYLQDAQQQVPSPGALEPRRSAWLIGAHHKPVDPLKVGKREAPAMAKSCRYVDLGIFKEYISQSQASVYTLYTYVYCPPLLLRSQPYKEPLHREPSNNLGN